MTSRGTFQKLFGQDELRQFIEDALDRTAVSVGVGIFFVFRDVEEQQTFLSSRAKRPIDWETLSDRLRARAPRVPRIREDLYTPGEGVGRESPFRAWPPLWSGPLASVRS